jgi:hypothetical protein
MMAWLGFLLVRPRGRFRKCCQVILIANLGLLSAALIQYKGYHYHFYPPLASALLLLGLLVLEVARPDTLRASVAGLACGGVLATVMVVVTTDLVRETRQSSGGRDRPQTPLEQMVQLAKVHAQHGSVFTFSANLVNSFPMVTYSGVSWASRHPCLWFLPALYDENPHESVIVYHPIEAMSDTERFLFESVVDDLLKYRPALLFVDEANPKWVFLHRRFDYLEYYSQDPRFAAFLKEYEPFVRVDVFHVYRRKAGNRMTSRR